MKFTINDFLEEIEMPLVEKIFVGINVVEQLETLDNFLRSEEQNDNSLDLLIGYLYGFHVYLGSVSVINNNEIIVYYKNETENFILSES